MPQGERRQRETARRLPEVGPTPGITLEAALGIPGSSAIATGQGPHGTHGHTSQRPATVHTLVHESENASLGPAMRMPPSCIMPCKRCTCHLSRSRSPHRLDALIERASTSIIDQMHIAPSSLRFSKRGAAAAGLTLSGELVPLLPRDLPVASRGGLTRPPRTAASHGRLTRRPHAAP